MTKWITVSLGQLACLGRGRRSGARRGGSTVRATSSWAESWLPPGITNLRRQLDLVHVVVDPLLELGDHLLGGAADPVFEPLGRLRRGRQLGAGDEDVVLEAEDVGGELGLARRRRGRGRRRAAEQASSSAP